MSKLTEKQKLFCEAYLRNSCTNARKAATEAGYSEKTARQQACTLLQRDDIKEYINSRKVDITEKTDLKLTELIESAKRIMAKGEETNPTGNYQNLGASMRALAFLYDIYESEKEDKEVIDIEDVDGTAVVIETEDCSIPGKEYFDYDEDDFEDED